MRTEAQIAASRANGAKSRGPITAIGRATSAQNSVTYGLSGAKLIVIEENLLIAGELSSKPVIANSTRPACAAATNTPSKMCTPAKTENFQTNPRIPANNPQK